MIKVDDGVPMPEKRPRVVYPVGVLEVGQSFEVPPGKENSVRSAVYAENRRSGRKFDLRWTKTGLMRCWRVE